jgi:hypothetical protein
MRFLRHLAAAALVVAAVVAGGLAWGRFADHLPPGLSQVVIKGVAVPGHKVEAVLPPGAHPGRRPPPGIHPRPGGGPVVIDTGSMNLGLDSMFQAVNLPVLRDTAEIEAGVIAAVVIIDIARRRLRRARRGRREPPAAL